MTESSIRFIVRRLFVSAFAVLEDVLKPKSFAGLFGAGLLWLASSELF